MHGSVPSITTNKTNHSKTSGDPGIKRYQEIQNIKTIHWDIWLPLSTTYSPSHPKPFDEQGPVQGRMPFAKLGCWALNPSGILTPPAHEQYAKTVRKKLSMWKHNLRWIQHKNTLENYHHLSVIKYPKHSIEKCPKHPRTTWNIVNQCESYWNILNHTKPSRDIQSTRLRFHPACPLHHMNEKTLCV